MATSCSFFLLRTVRVARLNTDKGGSLRLLSFATEIFLWAGVMFPSTFVCRMTTSKAHQDFGADGASVSRRRSHVGPLIFRFVRRSSTADWFAPQTCEKVAPDRFAGNAGLVKGYRIFKQW